MPACVLTRKPETLFQGQDAVFEWELIPDDASAKYMLEPADKRMHGPTSARRAVYPMLPEGQYTFHLIAVDSLGNTSEEVTYSFQVAGRPIPSEEAGEAPAAPVAQPKLARRRSTAASTDYNRFINDVHYDITNLAAGQAALRSRLSDALSVWQRELSLIEARILELETRLHSEIDSIVSEVYQPGEPHTRPIFPLNIMPGVPEELIPVYGSCIPADVDIVYGLVTLAESSPPQDRLCYRHPITGGFTAPRSTNSYIEPQGYGIFDGPIVRAIDHDDTTVWLRTVRRPIGYSGAETVRVALELPLGLANTPNINTVSLIPFPEGFADIVSVEYRPERRPLHEDSGWLLLPGYPSEFDPVLGAVRPKTIENACGVRWCFPDTAASAVRITLSLRSGASDPEGTVYVFGMKSLSVVRRAYSDGPCFAHIVFSSPFLSLPYSVYRITDIRAVFANESVLSEEGKRSCASFEFYLKQPDGTYASLRSLDNLLGQDTVLIVMMLRPDPVTHATPAIARVDVTYSKIA